MKNAAKTLIAFTAALILAGSAHAADGFGNIGSEGVYFANQDHPALDSSNIDAAEAASVQPAAGEVTATTAAAPADTGINSRLIESYFGDMLNGTSTPAQPPAAPAQ